MRFLKYFFNRLPLTYVWETYRKCYSVSLSLKFSSLQTTPTIRVRVALAGKPHKPVLVNIQQSTESVGFELPMKVVGKGSQELAWVFTFVGLSVCLYLTWNPDFCVSRHSPDNQCFFLFFLTFSNSRLAEDKQFIEWRWYKSASWLSSIPILKH